MWQPIETAPIDGREILFFDPDIKVCVGYADLMNGEPYWRASFDDQFTRMTPTHWMPLPAAPDA